MVEVVLARLGEGLAVPLPGEVANAANLSLGAHVEVQALDGRVVIRRLDSPSAPVDLFQGKTPEQWRAEYAGAFDWGPDIGREAISE